MKLKKPTKKTRSYYDYNECSLYLKNKYGFDESNYANKKYNGKSNDPPYQNFWHWIVKNHNICNGCFFTFSEEELENDEMEDWQKEIYKHYLDEFADQNGEIEFHIIW